MTRIYLDYAATTPVDPRVMVAMKPYFNKYYGNSMSLHYLGGKSDSVVDETRQIVADYIGGDSQGVVFTSSATESNNLALKGVMWANRNRGNHLMVSAIEHDCVLESAKWLAKNGFEVDIIPVNEKGMADIDFIKKKIKKTTILVSIIHGNNEIGVVQDVAKIGKICKDRGCWLHSDASQSFGRWDIDVKRDQIDLLTISSHKIYGPKGVGVLYIAKGVKIEPLLHGGGQENGIRSSTVNVPAIVGFKKAVEILDNNKENTKIRKLRDRLAKMILAKVEGAQINGDLASSLPHIVNISFASIEGESLLLDLDSRGVMISTGSACSSRLLESSHVLRAMGFDHGRCHGSIRFSLGRWTSEEEIERTVEAVKATVDKFRKISPFKINK